MLMILTKSEQFREQVPPAFSEQVKKCVVHNYVVSFQSLRLKICKSTTELRVSMDLKVYQIRLSSMDKEICQSEKMKIYASVVKEEIRRVL